MLYSCGWCLLCTLTCIGHPVKASHVLLNETLLLLLPSLVVWRYPTAVTGELLPEMATAVEQTAAARGGSGDGGSPGPQAAMLLESLDALAEGQ